MNLLIVEDNAQMRRMIRNVVKDLAEEISECADGAEALSLYEQHRPEWVLMDIRMQGVDGLSATRQIKSAFADARIIIVTNYDDAHLREAARQAGACDYVLKENLLEVVRILKNEMSLGVT
jgi:two-component system response regulator DegU